MEIGEHWAYCVRRADELTEVIVLAVGAKRPLRVKIRFSADEFEGAIEWVPPSRLKAPWTERHEYLAGIERWNSLLAEGRGMSAADDSATQWVIDMMPGSAAQRLVSRREMRSTVTRVLDWSALTQTTGLDRGDLWSSLAISENGADYLPWPAALTIATSFARQNPLTVLEDLSKELEDSLRLAARPNPGGHRYTGPSDPQYWVDDMRQVIATVRGWCEPSQFAAADEITVLRKSLADLTAIAEQEVLVLIRAERAELAWNLFARLRPGASKAPWRELLSMERRLAKFEPQALVDETRTAWNERRLARARLMNGLGIRVPDRSS